MLVACHPLLFPSSSKDIGLQNFRVTDNGHG